MLIIPFDRPIDWSRPPVATLMLVLINAAVFFGLQWNDSARLGEAVDYYYDSRLAELELPRYRDYLLAEGEEAFVREWSDELDEPGSPWLFRMLGDGPFMERLRAGEVVTPDSERYTEWRQQRQRFDDMLAQSTVMGWGLKPAELQPLTLVSHMFLHGGLMHLLGNMFFLLAVGFLVEMTLGLAPFLGLYLLGGLGAAGLFAAMNLDSAIPMVGASGAIAGLMGMYAVIYGLRRINFFYWVLVYFDYVKAPAIVLLPLWLGNELFQYFSAGGESRVAYMAHVGGLLTGAGLAFGYKQWGPGVDEDYIAEKERRERYDADMAAVEEASRALQPERAAAALRRLRREHPDDPRVLGAAYDAARFHPDTDDFHDIAHRILRHGGQGPELDELWLRVYRDYVRRARPKPRFPQDIVKVAAGRLLHLGEPREAARFVGIMQRHPETFPEAAEFMLRLANTFHAAGDKAAADEQYHRLEQAFPHAQEAKLARQRLGGLSR